MTKVRHIEKEINRLNTELMKINNMWDTLNLIAKKGDFERKLCDFLTEMKSKVMTQINKMREFEVVI